MKRQGLTRSLAPAALVLCTACALVACGKQNAPEVAPAPAAPLVSTLKLAPVTLTLDDELPGRVAALRTAEIRPQVGGIVLRRWFEQGAEVKAGQPLFEIDPAAFKAERNAAAAAFERAEAVAARARQQAARLQPLVAADAVSRQLYDDAVSAARQADADVALARATLARRALDVGYARVKAPIAGRVGQALVTEGALVGAGDANPMALVQQIDRVYVDVRQPAAMLDAIRAAAGGQHSADVAIVGANGRPLAVKGRILFSGINVDAATGDTVVRVEVDNRARLLLPGMYVRARLPRGGPASQLLVPQQALLRDSAGKPRVWVVDARQRARLRPVEAGPLVGRQYVLRAGVAGGDNVVVEGQERLQEGAKVVARPWKAAPGAGAATVAAAAAR
ncbi:multidrug efflux system membrane fusion protein [Duganella sp. 1411]|uniref:efflux RND transporter periplasmic adaptor subunit n=1 Tax=Duganella sp. 1411 TaxID=2806572 RepID=UPI001AE91BFB|nr:efflux RND transporter periplasmic adaptor subunit [Duganella sp. 1411]MBP1202087.1 multidrug efflux system membrane fusion protein [Duganella sp. 1411]